METTPASGRAGAPPLWLPLAAGLPVGLCLVVVALPALGNAHAMAFRLLYFAAFALWCLPLAWLQRWLWRRHVRVATTVAVLLLATYAMSLANNALGALLARTMEWTPAAPFAWTDLFRGLDSCWLALVAFCAMHALVAYYAALQEERLRLAETRSLARDAELRALRYQLHPHFLFNTLNAISALVVAERGREAREMIARLGDFLRATLDADGTHEGTLAEEVALTEAYLDIEKVRLGERLQLRWELGPGVLRARVPHLLLQPLVENAIRHGIARRSEPGRLHIDIRREDAMLRVRLENDIAPPDPAASGTVRGDALGQRNVRERLARLYPGKHAFAAGVQAEGYVVQVGLPFHEALA